MPVPFEALLPLGIVTAMFGVTGTLLHASKSHYHNWDTEMMERDRRLMGSPHRQTSEPIAPKEFSTNSVWYLTTKKILWQ
ncbi:5266_t:CDS:2 [Diversispora eburnea]|uniref:NADH dehydrogenase [ubiquinone] 1 alpha subcomplex subunit 1 n=1 Tax=Diversispora eburnea TaxID=1213867 RepID=A0A9N9FMF8_9GLOM|nr:5266_t:CDS:2 [Diversispora eburnea]